MRIDSDRCYRFAVPPSRLWAAVCDVRSFPRWWSWLHEFEGRRLAPGEVWECAVRPPLPYVLRFRLIIGEVDEARLVTATVEGDIAGRATLDITARPVGAAGRDLRADSEVRLRSSLAPGRRWLEMLATVAGPATRYGHDWVLDTGARQFAERATTATTTAAAPDDGADRPGGVLATPPERGGSRAAAD
jgi:uncharacterized protein YndB with AHSA1/START domain